MPNELDHTQPNPLTKREMEVLQLLAEGKSNREIADTLVVEVSTVKWYNSQIYDKLQVKNRKQAVIRAQTLGILEPVMTDPLLRIQHNLPSDTLPFIGRKREIQELVQQLGSDDYRLVTILGSGGMGKSRLAIEVGWKLLPKFRDGIYFLSLASVGSQQQIITTLAHTIGLKLQGDKVPKQLLLEYLQRQHMLLIADNFEHLIDVAALLTDILKAAPDIKILVTSRERLGLTGEFLNIISGLSTPQPVNNQVIKHDAVKLFAEVATRTTSPIQDTDWGIVAHICQMLGGMPLAIVLAAAWLDTLSLTEIETEIQDGLDILEANLRDTPARHQSIETVFDYSWRRLSEREQTIFMRLSVFREGFTREAAGDVTGATIRDLQRLVHTSFIQLTASGRYTVHELMRQYGEQKLKVSSETNTVREEHARFFAKFITPLGNTPWGMATREMLEVVNADFENVRAAWLFQVEQKNTNELRRFLDGIWHFLDQHSRSQEGIELLEVLLTKFRKLGEDATLFRGQLLARLAWFYSDCGQHQKAIQIGRQSLAITENFDAIDDVLMVYHLFNLVFGFTNSQEEADFYAEKGFEMVHKVHTSKWMIPLQLDKLGCCFRQGNVKQAQQLFGALPDYKFRVQYECILLREAGDTVQAEELMLNSMEKYHYHRIEYCQNYSTLAKWALLDDDYEKAWTYVQRGLRYGDNSSYVWGTFYSLGRVPSLLIIEQKYYQAAEVLSFLLHHPANIDFIKTAIAVLESEVRGKLLPEEFEIAWERGKQLDLDEVITEYMER